MFRIFIAVLMAPIVLVILQACSPKTQESNGFVQNVYGQRISWKGHIPIRLQIHESVPAQFIPGLLKAADIWNVAIGKKLFEVDPNPVAGPLLPRKDGLNMIYWSNEWDPASVQQQARTNIFWVGDEIRESDILFNAKDYGFYVDKGTADASIDLISVGIHEMGHVLGLTHEDSKVSVMHTYLKPLEERRQISDSDIESIRYEY